MRWWLVLSWWLLSYLTYAHGQYVPDATLLTLAQLSGGWATLIWGLLTQVWSVATCKRIWTATPKWCLFHSLMFGLSTYLSNCSLHQTSMAMFTLIKSLDSLLLLYILPSSSSSSSSSFLLSITWATTILLGALTLHSSFDAWSWNGWDVGLMATLCNVGLVVATTRIRHALPSKEQTVQTSCLICSMSAACAGTLGTCFISFFAPSTDTFSIYFASSAFCFTASTLTSFALQHNESTSFYAAANNGRRLFAMVMSQVLSR